MHSQALELWIGTAVMIQYYAGIGSRKAPVDTLREMRAIAMDLSELDWTLRSGGAEGSDRAFEWGAEKKEIFKVQDAQPWCYEMVKKYLPTDRKGFDNWKPYVQGLLARNMQQLFGRDGKTPVEFVVCWTPTNVYTDSSSGGTAYAIRAALDQGIPVYNLNYNAYAFHKFLQGLKDNEV